MTATLDTQALKKLDQAHHLHPFTDFEDYAKHGGRIVSRAEHIYIYDSDGNKIQDGMSGLWCCNLGYSQDRIKQAVAEQLAELLHRALLHRPRSLRRRLHSRRTRSSSPATAMDTGETEA